MIHSNTPERSIAIEEADLADVNKGTLLPSEWCQRFTGIRAERNSEEYRLRLLALQGRIESLLCRREDDYGIIVKQEGLGLLVLTDEQAVVYTAKRQDIALRHWHRMMRKQLELDDSELTQYARDLHHHQRDLSTRMAIAIKRIREEESKLKSARKSSDAAIHFARPASRHLPGT